MLGVEDREKTHDGLFCLQNEVVNGLHGYYIYIFTCSLHFHYTVLTLENTWVSLHIYIKS